MSDKNNKYHIKNKIKTKFLLLAIVISIFVFLVSFGTLYAQTHIIEGTACSCTLPIPLLIPTFSSFGVIVGAIVYYFVAIHRSEEYEILRSRIERLPIKDFEKNDNEKFKIFLDFLDNKERIVIEKIVENNGEITQSKLSKIMGKINAFRVVESLKKRGIIKKEKFGKTNRIILEEKYKKILTK
ncbi:MAG: hypothetical protein QXJ96_01475 [Candidatus Aenigmatarchaeota archaeon]|nr:hypothetical protein [Candidatus Aenigmarchaeota archaeon]